MTSIDRDSYTPAYAQLAELIQKSIAKGIFKPGDQLPSEAQLCKRFEVSPMTVRRAINTLIDQGIVIAEKGRGTFVKAISLGEAAFQLSDLQNLFVDTNNTLVHILETRIAKASPRISKKLKVPIGYRTVYIRRMINSSGKPALYHREYLVYDPTRPVVESELEVTALHQLFSGAEDSILKWGEIRMDPTLLNDKEAELLQVDRLPAAAICLQHVFYDFDDIPLSWGWFIGHPDFLKFQAHVGLL